MESAASADSAVMQEQLVVLKSLKQKTQELVDFKATLLQKTELLDHKQNLLEEIVAERQRLQKERKVLLDMLQAVQRDVDTVKEAEQSLGRERDELQLTVNKIRNEQYETLHDEVNELRLRCGLPKIPHIQQELEAHMARTLEERREKWQQQDSPTPSSVPSSSRRRDTSASSSTSQRGRPRKRRQ